MENVRLKNQYVMLTGSKSNAGDFLIKHRAKKLLAKLRPDRDIIDYDAWKALTADQIKTINESKALLLTGGPSVQKNMYPSIYALSENLEDIQVPIIAFGVGWKGHSHLATSDYSLSKSSLSLLERVNSNGYSSSVRDEPTNEMLIKKNLKNFVTTGCPALYDIDKLGQSNLDNHSFKKISFSPGVSFIKSSSMDKQTKDLLLDLKRIYPKQQIEIAFHHPVSPKGTKNVWIDEEFNSRHLEFIDWLTDNGFSYVDISGAAEKLIHYYSQSDLHIGYRVHAHIFMISQNKPSILVSEDSRALSLKTVIGGTIVEGHNPTHNFILKAANKILGRAQIGANSNTVSTVNRILTEEGLLINETLGSIERKNKYFSRMRKFIEMLP